MHFVIVSGFGQAITLDLTFTAVDSAAYVQLDSIKVMNRTQGSETMIYWPDTILTLEIIPGDLLLFIGYATYYPVGLQEINQEILSFQLSQNYPNPVKDQSMISMYIPEKGAVSMMVTDIRGRVIISYSQQMDKGIHSFRFSPGDGSLYFLTARWNGMAQSIKIIHAEPNTGKRCLLDYIINSNETPLLKVSSPKTVSVHQSGILDSPATNENYIFQFATNIPCPGISTVTYGGQVYNTIQIFSQCWLKENLNVGAMINGNQNQTNNGIIEKYCYFDQPDSCIKYGGLYRWDEIMMYTAQEGTRGICPPDWHIPTDEEWKVLEGAMDSQYGIGDTEWDTCWIWRGFDAGTNQKTTSGWSNNGNGTDLFGFSGLPGGYLNHTTGFGSISISGNWWTSTQYDIYSAWSRSVGCVHSGIYRYGYDKADGFSLRCIKD